MRLAACVLMITAAPVAAANLSCILQDVDCTSQCSETVVAFAIDPAQFAEPISPNDPPRRQVTHVTLNGSGFTAAAILMPGGIMGFHTDNDSGDGVGDVLMVTKPDGTARMTLRAENRSLSESGSLIGRCVRT